jgi:hypothetical protein
MGKGTRSLSGASQKKYFRDLFGAAEGVTPEAAEALATSCEREIAQVRVRLPVPERSRSNKSTANQPITSAQDTAAVAFDPFAFSVVVVMTREGRDGLARKLAGIAAAANLKALAKAQHIAIPEGDLGTDELRSAIIDGALQRIANRKAAAS